MIGNPEFRRNVWLELTPQRLVVMPLVLAGIFAVAYFGEANVARWSGGSPFYAGLATTAKYVYLVLVLLWGGRQAAAAVTDEIRDRTWDGQRLSALGSWSMTWGKLFGSTVFVWLGGVLTLVVFAASSFASRRPPPVAADIVILVGYGVLCHATSMMASLLFLRHRARARKPNATLFHLAGLAAVAGLWWTSRNFDTGVRHWPFETTVSRDGVELVSVVAFAAWAVIGLWRLMRAELQFRNLPWLWTLFLVFLCGYVAFLAGSPWTLGRFIAPCVTLFICTYLLALVEPKDVVVLRRLLRRARTGQIRGFFEILPLSLLTYAISAAAVVALILFGRNELAPPGATRDVALMLLTALLFMSRDLGILLALNLGRNPGRADLAAILYWGVLYVLVPLLLDAFGLREAAPLFRPDGTHAALLSALVQAVLVLIWVVWRWRTVGRAVGLAKSPGTGQIPG